MNYTYTGYVLGSLHDTIHVDFVRKSLKLRDEAKVKGKWAKDTIYRYEASDADKLCVYVEFTLLESTSGTRIMYIDGIHRTQYHSKFPIGMLLLYYILRKAKRNNVNYVYLIAMDEGSGKLFDYYYQMGFRCHGYTELSPDADDVEKWDTSDYHAFLKEDMTIINFKECFYMKADLESLLDSMPRLIDQYLKKRKILRRSDSFVKMATPIAY